MCSLEGSAEDGAADALRPCGVPVDGGVPHCADVEPVGDHGVSLGNSVVSVKCTKVGVVIVWGVREVYDQGGGRRCVTAVAAEESRPVI